MRKEYKRPEIDITSIRNTDVVTLSVATPPIFDAKDDAGVNKSDIPF